jgi:conjugative transfer pilus assembly protein TraH
VSVAPPSFDIGCGGIDVFMGGIGFMDADYFVQKLKSTLKQAPYVAFDLGLKALCSECSEVIKTVEQMANSLNSMDFDECAAANSMVTVATGLAADVANDRNTVLAGVGTKVSKGVGSFWEDLRPESPAAKNDTKKFAVEQLSPNIKLKNWLTNGGSLLDFVGSNFNINVTDIQTARAYFGDIFYDKGSAMFVEIKPCSNVEQMDRMIAEGMFIRRSYLDLTSANNPALCVREAESPIQTSITALQDIVDKLENNATLNSTTTTLIERTTLPILTVLKRSYAADEAYGDTIRTSIAPVVAGSYVYSPMMLLGSTMQIALADLYSQLADNSLSESDAHIREYAFHVGDVIQDFQSSYNDQLRNYGAAWSIIASIQSDTGTVYQ